MAVTAFGPGGDASGDVENEVALMLLSQRPMTLQDSKVKMTDRVGRLETAVDDVFDDLPGGQNVPTCSVV